MRVTPSPSGAPGRLPRRLLQLYGGLLLFGASVALQLRAGLGLNSWDVFHQGVARHTGLSIGTVVVLASAAVLLLWVPLRERPGLGTVSNVLLVGLSMDATLALVPAPGPLLARVPLFLAAVVLNGAATGLYLAARLGPGPRDGLMTGLCRVTGRSTRLVRTTIEVAVLAAGFLLGGSVGVGTVVYAVTIGPLIQFFHRLFTAPHARSPDPEGVGAARHTGSMSIHENLLGGPPPTHLPDDPEPRELLAAGTAPADVAAKHPTSSLAWAQLADDAFEAGRVVESYAYARTGYHRGLDALRRNGWKGHGPVPFEHEPNRGFLRALHALARAAQAIGEQEEYERCTSFLKESSPTAAATLG